MIHRIATPFFIPGAPWYEYMGKSCVFFISVLLHTATANGFQMVTSGAQSKAVSDWAITSLEVSRLISMSERGILDMKIDCCLLLCLRLNLNLPLTFTKTYYCPSDSFSSTTNTLPGAFAQTKDFLNHSAGSQLMALCRYF